MTDNSQEAGPDDGDRRPLNLDDSHARALLRIGLGWVSELPVPARGGRSGDVIGGRLELKALIGSGGMGEVWRAFHRSLTRDVAVKIIDPALGRDQEFLERFRLEALAAQAVVHENVVQVRDFGADTDGRVYLTMDLVDGRSLADIMTDAGVEERPLERGWVLEVMGQVLAGLQAAHDAGVIHRDIKPGNILIGTTARGIKAQLTDFGVAAALPDSALPRTVIDARITRTGTTVGTLAYMSPEQASGKDVTATADIYSAGVILYELLTGHLPTEGRNEREFRQNLMTRRPRSLRAAAEDPSIPETLDKAVLKALAFDPADRYASASAFAAALRQAVRPVGRRPWCAWLARRWRTALAILVGAAVVLAAILVAPRLMPSRPGAPPPLASRPSRVGERGAALPPPTPVDPAEEARRTGVDLVVEIPLGRAVTMQMVFIPAGEFFMGSPTGERGRRSEEGPRHRVRISRHFYLGATEVTQAQYRDVMDTDPSFFVGPDRPVDTVRWTDAETFCARLTERERAAGRLKPSEVYRLPTEAEWEYACRAGTTSPFSFAGGAERVDDFAWYHLNSGRGTQPVRRKRPNPWGLFDMHGNVSEWCADWREPYAQGLAVDPSGPTSGSDRVLRGGFWGAGVLHVRSAFRDGRPPGTPADHHIGFRCVRTIASSSD